MTLPDIQQLAQLVAERALNSISGGLLIAVLAWLLLRVVGRQNSGTRFAVWFLALLAIAGIPFVPAPGHHGVATHATSAAITLPWFWALGIFAVWVLFSAIAAARLLAGLSNLRRLRRSAVPLIPADLHPLLREVLAQCEAIRPVTVCSSLSVTVPTAIGFFKPLILIPEWALRNLPAVELKIILLHEFAHLRRWDDWTNLAQKIVRTVLFFHPAVWWIEKRLALEREMACDDAVLVETRNPRAYAECLVSLAEKTLVQRTLAMAHAAISHARETSIRLARILDARIPEEDRTHAPRTFKPALGLMAALVAGCLITVPNAPRLIAFGNAAKPQSLASVRETLAIPEQAHIVPPAMQASSDRVVQTGHRRASSSAVHRPSKFATKIDGGMSGELAGAGQGQYGRPVVAVPSVAKQSTPAPEFLLVMQTAEFDDQGSVVLRVSVWRVTFTSSNRNSNQQGVMSKSI